MEDFTKRYERTSTEIVQTLIRNMRHVREYAAVVKGVVVALEGKNRVADVMAPRGDPSSARTCSDCFMRHRRALSTQLGEDAETSIQDT